MYPAVVIKMKDRSFLAYLDGLAPKAQKITKREAWNLTQFGARMMREAHSVTSEAWRGHIRKGIKARKLGKGAYGIEFSKAAIALDRMRPHYVSLGKGHKFISAWTKERFGSKVVSGKSRVSPDRKRGAVFVTPHPYIEIGFQQIVNRLDIVANRIANGVVG